MSADEPQTDREWLMRIDGKIDNLLICQEDHETRIRDLRDAQMKWFGRDGAIVAGISAVISITGIAIAFWRQ
ncbi:MAG: hypothetical protein WC294_06465 [Methanoregula sp.]